MLWVVGAYIAVLLLIAWINARRETLTGYFTNEKSSSLPLLVASNTSTFIGAGALMFAGEAHRSGISIGILQLSWALFGCLVFAYFAPRIKKIADQYGIFTLPDFFGARYGNGAGLGMALTQVLLLTTWAAIQVVAVAKLVAMFFSISYEIALVGSALVVVFYSAAGGLKTDIISDYFQFWVMLVGLGLLLYFSVSAAGGVSAIIAHLPKGHLDPYAFAPPATLIVGSIMTSLFSLSNSGHWQRVASSKSLNIVMPSYLWAVPFCVFFVGAATLIGLAAISIVAPLKDPDQLLFVLGRDHVPAWAGGLVVAAILATVMSTIDSLLIALSTITIKQTEQFFPRVRVSLRRARLVTLLIGIFIFAIALGFPTLLGLSLFSYNLGIALLPAILGALYNRPKGNVARALAYGVILTLGLYYFFEKSTFLATLPISTVLLFWPFKKTPTDFSSHPIYTPDKKSRSLATDSDSPVGSG